MQDLILLREEIVKRMVEPPESPEGGLSDDEYKQELEDYDMLMQRWEEEHKPTWDAAPFISHEINRRCTELVEAVQAEIAEKTE